MKRRAFICLLVATAIGLLSGGCAGKMDKHSEPISGVRQSKEIPWEAGGKQPVEYTWGEFESLSEEQQEAFFESFSEVEEFEAWMMEVQREAVMPWEREGRLPEEYSWKEYEALTDMQRERFVESFTEPEKFLSWMTEVQRMVGVPWEAGGKVPEEYSREEFEALSGVQKEAFFESFATPEDFIQWYDQVKPKDAGAK